MKTSLYSNLIQLFAALQQMKHVRLSNNNYNILMACFMFDFQKTVYSIEKKLNAHENTNLIQHNVC